jgi:hypothetical protein
MKSMKHLIMWLYAVLLASSPSVADQLVTRRYSVSPSFIDVVVDRDLGGTNEFPTLTKEPRSDGNLRLREFFTDAGLTISSGGQLTYIRSSSELQLTGSEEEHVLLEELLNQTGSIDQQVEVIVTMFRGSADAYRMGTNNVLRDVQSLRDAFSNGFSVVSSIAGMSRSGVNCEVSAGSTTLNFTPTIGPDVKTVDVTLVWSCSTNETDARTITTSVALHSQCTLVLQAHQRSNIVELVTVTANLVNIDGKIHRKRGDDN